MVELSLVVDRLRKLLNFYDPPFLKSLPKISFLFWTPAWISTYWLTHEIVFARFKLDTNHRFWFSINNIKFCKQILIMFECEEDAMHFKAMLGEL